jgi:putative transcription antitermination factor YqgF
MSNAAPASVRRSPPSSPAPPNSAPRASSSGLPLDEQGEDTPRAAEARRLGVELGARTGHPVEMVDERFSTAAALRAIKEMEGSTRGRKGDVDALAAAILLRTALEMMDSRDG